MKIKYWIEGYLENQGYLKKDEMYTGSFVKLSSKGNVVIEGGRMDLIQLADILVSVALLNDENACVCLGGSNFFDECSTGLIIKNKINNSGVST